MGDHKLTFLEGRAAMVWPIRRSYQTSSGVEHAILRFNNGFIEVPIKWVREAQYELELKAVANIDDMTAVDRLAYIILSETF